MRCAINLNATQRRRKESVDPPAITEDIAYSEGMGAAIVLWICFLGWLMWSSKSDKEVFLFYAWVTMLVVGMAGLLYEAIFGVIT